MKYLIAIYMFLLIFRPFEYWPALGEMHIERVYMLFLLAASFFYRDKRLELNTVHIWLLGFMLSLVLSTLAAIDVPVAWEATWRYQKIVIFYVVLAMTMNNQEELEFIAKAFLVVMLVYVGKSAWEFFFHGRHVYRMGIRRMVGIDTTWGMPNAFAATIVFSLPVVWALLGKGLIKRWVRLAVLAYAALAPVCIIMTGSRSGMVTFLFFVGILSWRAKRKTTAAVLSAVLLVVAWQFVPDLQQRRFLSIFMPEVGPAAEASHTSAQSRIAGLKHGFALMLDDPLSGVGPNNFRKTWYGDYGLQAHNLYGQVMGELGLLGVVAFFGFLLAVWWRLWRNARLARERGARARDPDEKRAMLFLQRLSSAGMMIILLMLFSGNFAHILYRYQWLLVAFFAVAGAGILEGSAAGSAVPRQAADEQSSMEFA